LHRRSAREVGARHRETIGQATHRVADLQAEVPERVENSLGHALDVRIQLAVVHDHQIEIRERMELAPPVSTQRHQYDRRLDRALPPGIVGRQAEQRLEEAVHERGIRLHGLLAGRAAEVGRSQEVDVRRQVLAKELEPESPATVCTLGNAYLKSALGLRLHASKLAEKLRRHWRNVIEPHPYCQTWRQLVARLEGRRVQWPPMRKLWRPVVEKVSAYDAGKSLEQEIRAGTIVRLSANESPLGPSPKVIEAIRREAARAHLYPDGGSTELREALGRRLGVGADWIVVGNGADEVLTLLARAAYDPGDEIVIPQPGFEPYGTEATLAGCTVVASPLRGYDTDLDDMRIRVTPRTKAVIVCTPHNPA